jgi:hypothetical protein
MACYYPLKGYRSRARNENGNFFVVFNPRHGYLDMPITVPCGQCLGCRLEKSRQWAVRCMHHASLYENNTFITLTYNNESLPRNSVLVRKHVQLFIKRLRRSIERVHGKGHVISYLYCGEYGEKNGRPHYHLILFNYDFDDKELYKKTRLGDYLYNSKRLEKLWGKGFAVLGDVTFESCAYVSRYILKKINGDMAEDHYTRVDENGEIYQLPKEFSQPSLKTPIGKEWFKKYWRDLYPKDFVTMRGVKFRPPQYYDRCLKKLDEQLYDQIKYARKQNILDVDQQRLEMDEFCKRIKTKSLVRDL